MNCIHLKKVFVLMLLPSKIMEEDEEWRDVVDKPIKRCLMNSCHIDSQSIHLLLHTLSEKISYMRDWKRYPTWSGPCCIRSLTSKLDNSGLLNCKLWKNSKVMYYLFLREIPWLFLHFVRNSVQFGLKKYKNVFFINRDPLGSKHLPKSVHIRTKMYCIHFQNFIIYKK